MPSEASMPRRRRWHPLWWLLGLTLAVCGWMVWREYDFRAAIREAKAAGWQYERRDPVTLILADWRTAGMKATWKDRYSRVGLPVGTDLATAAPLLSRLRPTRLVALRCPDTHLDALRGLTALQRLDLSAGSRLQFANWNDSALPPTRRGIITLGDLSLGYFKPVVSHEGTLRTLRNWYWYMPWEDIRTTRTLRGIPVPNDFHLYSTGPRDVDALRGLSALRELDLHGCMGLQNVDGLRGLPALATLYLSGCTGLQNVDGLRDLPALQRLNLVGCTGLSVPALRELRTALPEARIAFPDGTLDPPQPKREVWLWGVSVVLPTDEEL